MRKRVCQEIPLYVGDLRDCAAADAGMTVVHACRSPCFTGKCGTPAPGSPNYLHLREGPHLYLNLIDPETPLFQRESFETFLRFARDEWETGLPMLIHCNKGNSRAPALAILFLAKVLYRIRNSSFDDAWVDFEKMVGEPFEPGQGLELWLREHWSELDLQKRPDLVSQDVQALKRQAILDAIPKDNAAAQELFRTQPLFHFSLTEIQLADHKWGTPKANILQHEMAKAYAWCIEHEQKCRMIVLKPRKVGCSTFAAELCYHHMRRFQANMLLLGDTMKRVEGVFGMFNSIHQHDRFPWSSSYEHNTLRGKFHYADGGVGLVQRDTALDNKVGIGETRTVVWATESARYNKTGVVTDKQVMSALLNSIPDIPLQLVIAESTAEGAAGWFYETWQNGFTIDEIAKGAPDRWNGWITVFQPWFAFPEHRMTRTSRNAIWFERASDERERRGVEIYGWNEEQIAWRRRKISEDCNGDALKFDEDFPEDPQSAFLTSGRPRFNLDGVTKLWKKAIEQHDKAETGYLNKIGERLLFVPAAGGDSWLWVAEQPEVGRSYICFLDPCTGAQNQGAKDPDAHAPGIIREGYHDRLKVWHNPRLVACIDVPGGCRWEDDVLALRLTQLADWYGGCMIVPETGQGLGALGELQRFGATIYKRQKFNTMNPGQTIDVAGWETNTDTRPKVINALGEAIREGRFDCEYLPAVQQMRTFVINDRKAEAARGAHDDWVLGLGIGLYCLDFAEPYRPKATVDWRDDRPVAIPMLSGGVAASAFS